MNSFLIDMCRSCLTTNVNLKEYMVVKDKEIKCFDAVKMIFPNTVVPAYYGYDYSLCEVCVNLLKSAENFQRRLFESHHAYRKYMAALNFSNHYKFSILTIQHIDKAYLSMQKADEGCRPKLTENTGNQIPTNSTYFEDSLKDEDLNCGTYNDFDNVLSELDTKVDIKENIPAKTSQEECKNMDNLIADNVKKEIIIADNNNCNQMDFSITENISYLKNIKEEQDKDIPMLDKDGCYELVSKIEVKEEHTAPWERTKNGHEHFEAVYDCEDRRKHEILANCSVMDFKKEKTTIINNEEKTSPIKQNVNHKRKGLHKCGVCGKSFSNKPYLLIHKRFHTGERLYKCDICEKSCCQKQHLIIHKRIHTGEKPYKCAVCEKGFSCASNLNQHKRTHTGELPYKCDICERRFSSTSGVIKHKRIHTGEKPHKCDVCEKSFSNSTSLIIHKRIHTGEKPYKCDVCEKSFSVSSSLIKHKRIHTGEQPYKCEVCEKSFYCTSNLISHKRTHTGERPYKCEVCEKSFSVFSNLIGHKRIHTGERPYKCEVCEKNFSIKSSLNKHKHIHTREQPKVANMHS